MTYIHKSPRAKQDLIEIAVFLATDSVSAAQRFLTASKRAFDLIVETPELIAPVKCGHSRIQSIRKWPIRGFPNHWIFYRAIKHGIEIIRVLHAARDIASILANE